MIKVIEGQDPYSVIGKYIRDHITAIEDIIAVIEIDGITTNQLFMVDMNEDGYFIWKSDWYEGEKDIVLIDFFPVSEAKKSSAEPTEQVRTYMSLADCVSRQAAIDALNDDAELLKRALDNMYVVGVEREKYAWGLGLIESYISDMKELPSAEPERTEYIPDTKAVRSKRDCVDLAERITATFYDQEHEEWIQQNVTIADVLDSVCDEYTILPSAEPERKTGRWIADGNHTDHNGIEWSMMHCSSCGHKDIDSEVTRTPFCPWCGEKMEGENDG